MTGYELWETRTGNLMASYETQADALDVVARTVRAHGADRVMSFALFQVDDDGDLQPIASGTDLVALAEKTQAA
jgi:hypothetical protein